MENKCSRQHLADFQRIADGSLSAQALHVAVANRSGASLVHGMQMCDKARKLGT
jgi:hypothetical protein